MDEYRLLAELVLAGRADEAVALMESHLSGFENRFDLMPRRQRDDGLRRTLIGAR